MLFHGQRAEKFPFAVGLLDLRNVFRLSRSRTTRGLGTLAAPGPALKSCWNLLRGCMHLVERAVGGTRSSPLPTTSAQHGRHALGCSTSPSRECVLDAVISHLGNGLPWLGLFGVHVSEPFYQNRNCYK